MGKWIKVHDKILEWEWFEDGYTLRVFIYLLIAASFKKEQKNDIELDAGMVATNIPTIASMTRMSENWARRSVNNLLNTGEISVVPEKSNKRYRVFKISSWRKYQISSADEDLTTCTSQHAPHDVDCTSCTSQCGGPHNVNLTTCGVTPHNVEGSLTIPYEDMKTYINTESNNTLFETPSAHTHTREDMPIEWKNLANEIYTIYPMKKGNPQMALTAICKAIEDSGDFEHFKEVALNAVKKYADAVSRWPDSDKRFVTPLAKFFENGMYNNDPSTFEAERKNSGFGFNGMTSNQGGYDKFKTIHKVTDEDLGDAKDEVF